MSEKDDLIREFAKRLNVEDLDGAVGLLPHDFVFDWENSIGPLRGRHRGHAAARSFLESFLDAWEDIQWTTSVLFEGPEVLLIRNEVTMRGRGSGATVDATGYQVWRFRDREPVSATLYQDEESARAAAAA